MSREDLGQLSETETGEQTGEQMSHNGSTDDGQLSPTETGEQSTLGGADPGEPTGTQSTTNLTETGWFKILLNSTTSILQVKLI